MDSNVGKATWKLTSEEKQKNKEDTARILENMAYRDYQKLKEEASSKPSHDPQTAPEKDFSGARSQGRSGSKVSSQDQSISSASSSIEEQHEAERARRKKAVEEWRKSYLIDKFGPL